MFNQLINAGLRAATLGSKLVSIIVFARFLPVADYVLFGIVYAFIAYAVYVTSFNFYAYSARSVVKGDIALKKAFFNHVGIVLVAALVFISIAYFALKEFGGEYMKYFFYLFIIYLAEQLSHEFYHFLIAAQRQLAAGVAFFLRVGFWPFCACVWMYFEQGSRSVEVLFVFWSIGSAVSALFSAICIVTSQGYKNSECGNSVLSLSWIKAGILIAAPLMLSTLLVRGVLSFDRIWLLSSSNQKMVGAYVLIVTIGNALIAFLEAGLFSFVYPKLIRFRSSMAMVKFRRQILLLYLSCTGVTLLFSAAFLILVPYIMEWSGKQEYMQYAWVEYYILFFVICFALGMVAQYGLYALEADKCILVSHACGVLIFVLGWIFLPETGGHEVLVTICLSFLIAGVLKVYYLQRHLFELNKSNGGVV